MNKQELLLLEKMAALAPKEIEKKQSNLFLKLNEKASVDLKASVESKLKDAPKEVKDSLKKIDFSSGKIAKIDIKEELSKKLLTGKVSAERKKQVQDITKKLPELGKLEDVLLPNLPVFVNPTFQPELAKAKVYRLSDIAGVSQTKIDKAIAKELSLSNISSLTIQGLVSDKVLTDTEAKDLGFASNLYTFLDADFDLTEQVKKSKAVKSIKDLVTLNQSDWLKFIKESKIKLPQDIDQEKYAKILQKKAENLFPEEALLHRVAHVNSAEISKGIDALKPLTKDNEQLFGLISFDDLKKEGLSAGELKNIQNEYDKLNRISKTHPGLKLNEVLNDKTISAPEKEKKVIERIGLLEKFVKNNEGVNFLTLSYTHDSEDIEKLNFKGLKTEEKAMVLDSVKTYQRVYSFTNDIEATEAILAAGFHSSFQITSVTLPQFIQTTKLDVAIATEYFENAHMSIIRATGVMGSILDIMTGSFDWTAVGNTNPAIKNYLRDIPGYQDLFGELSFCECEHCQSIYSPAAYFVDLMQFVQKHVLTKHFSGGRASHVLNLKVRRPDLWTLPLTCENTSTLVPYLDIINEILESYIAKKKGFSGDLNNRSQVEDFVYKREIAMEKPGNWKANVNAFNQPFHLPLESVSTYLGHFEKTREDVALLLEKPQNEVSKTRLNLSDKEFQLITVPDNTPTFLNKVYGITFTITAGKITPFNAQQLLKAMQVNRKELGVIIETGFVTNRGAINVVIQGEKISADSIQNDIERIKNLTYDVLDRIHRFVRLWRKTSWCIQELDLILKQLQDAGVATTLDESMITAVGNLHRLQSLLEISVEQLSAVWYLIPDISIEELEESLLDQLFNHKDVIVDEGVYPKNTTKFVHPSLVIDNSTTPAEFSSSRFMAALNRSDDEVLSLVKHLAQPLGIVSLDAATESERGFNLTLTNLSLLYRHSLIAEVLKLSITELFNLLTLIPAVPNGFIENINHIYALLDFHRWWKSSTYSFDELNFILENGEVINPENFKTKEGISTSIIEEVKTANALQFAETVFASFDGITESQSKQLILANSTIIEQAPESTNFWLKPDFDPTVAINIPAGITKPEIEIREFLTTYHPNYLLPFYLSSELKLSEEVITKLITTLGIDLDTDAYTLELQGVTTPAVALPSLIEKLLPLSVLLKDKKFNTKSITYILDHLSIVGITSIDTVTIENIKKIQAYKKLIVLKEDESNNIELLNTVLNSYVSTTQYQTSDQEKLAALLEIKEEQLASIHAIMPSSSNAIESLNKYKSIADFINYTGVSGSVLPKIISTQYVDLNAATQALIGAFRSKYKTEDERKEKLEKYQDKLRGKKRTSLTTYLIHSGFPQFENENDLFHYFLIDTELEGCARTSHLVAATMSLQLYIHRILLNLEQDDLEPGTSGRVHVLASDVPAEEWEWRKNYRVWEANRKVFLYPENYIEPELRDDKSPLFEELENELLQQEINADTVLDAYAKYMRGFDEVAHLKIAGSYQEKDEKSETDVLHLFGVTADEPAVYYYRRVENLYYAEKNDNRGVVWGSWEKITVQIPVKKVAPITYNGRVHVFWVNVTTLANTVFDNNRSIFTGYSHKLSIEFTTLKLDGSWSSPQKLNLKNCYPFGGNNGVLQDPLAEDHERSEFQNELRDILRSFPFFVWNSDEWDDVREAINKLKTPRFGLEPHYEPIDGYTLEGHLWDQVYPYIDSSGKLILTGAGYQMRSAVDFYKLDVQNLGVQMSNITGFTDPAKESITVAKNKPGKIIKKEGNVLFRASSPNSQLFDNYAYGSLLVNTLKDDELLKRHWKEITLNSSFDDVRKEQIGSLERGSSVQIINGIFSDAIIDSQGDLLLLQGSTVEGNEFIVKRIGTTLSETLTRTLFTSGIETTLSIETQKKLKEAPVPINITPGKIENLVASDKIDFKGAYGNYYREIFFHIPFLLANHLNSQGKYAEAQKWYHYIFNPGANEVIDFSTPGLTSAQKKKMALDRNWQYLEFRDIDTQKLRDQLNDKEAIEVYKKDPFNPHAIARLRMSAYQKCIVMKYIDNLLDWGDQLFSQDTMESINEATLLYVIAKEILGDRPAQIGDCGEGKANPKTYENIQPLLNSGSEFLAELESYTIVKTASRKTQKRKTNFIENNEIKEKSKQTYRSLMKNDKASYRSLEYGNITFEYEELAALRKEYFPETTIKPVNDKVTAEFSRGTIRGLNWKKDSIYTKGKYRIPSFSWSILKHISPVFCVPGNKDLLSYYDRVDDRLYKIRNCMNIQGQKRQLALFSPEIDPRLLVRARAAGLSLDDILNSISGNLPPYRFTYILEKAKSFTSMVQSFGSSLLTAIEKKNGEDLSLLRMKQQNNILEMSSKSRRLEIDSANEGIKVLNDRLSSLNYQIGYYESLVSEHINPNERAQQIFRHSVSALQIAAGLTDTIAGILYLIPQVGSPFAMKYGGQETGNSANAWAMVMKDAASVAEAISSSAGLEAGFDRRSQGWKHQKQLLQYEVKQTEKNLIAAEIRRDILIESEKIHQKNIEHNKDVMDFYGEKFSNLGLYTWLSSTMQRLFREAYNNALSIARLAEQAYRYERDDNTIFLDGNYFEASRGGLLSGEKLMMSLQTMERRYLETNYRKNEIDQAFSLTQIDPNALLLLKQTGSCEFSVPEVFFDLFYPGQYRRKIQSVRLTIPSITGPYTNVSANLSLQSSRVRMEPKLSTSELKEVPKSRTTTIATSTAQNDAGVFQLNFRDDRYMPFEGAGAISSWKLSLPKNFRQFDYSTINDVIIHISYVAEYDELFRDKVEEQNDSIEGTLLNVLKNNSLSRTFSFRQEFSNDFHRLTNQVVNSPITVKIQSKHFPFFMNGKNLKVNKAKLIVVTPPNQTVAGLDISLNDVSQTGFTKDPTLGDLYSKDLGSLFNTGILKDHIISILNGGDLSPTPAAAGPIIAVDNEKLEDIILYLEYNIE